MASVNVVKAGSVNANQVRNFIAAQPGYDPTKWNAAQTTYNGISMFDAASLTNGGTFSPANNIASNNPLFVPGITWNQNRATQQISGGQLINWLNRLAFNYRSDGGRRPIRPSLRLSSGEARFWQSYAADIYNRCWTGSTGWTAIKRIGSTSTPRTEIDLHWEKET